MLEQLKRNQQEVRGTILFDFENDLSLWKQEGTAFSASPAMGSLEYQNAVIGFKGKGLVNSFYSRDAATGKITSPSFLITKKYISFLIGGGDHPHETCINLIVDDTIAETKTGVNTEILYWANWDVEKYTGKKATIEIVDNNTGGFGHILVDQIMLRDEPAKNMQEATSWIDYGPDFYAERSWLNAPGNRRIWVAWLGSWLYATSVPTNPWKGGHTFPRAVSLKTFPEGIKLIQQPVDEIKKLREKPVHFENIRISEGNAFTIPGVPDNAYELEAEFEIKDTGNIIINLCKGTHEKTVLIYDAKNEAMKVDRTQSGETSFSVSFPHVYQAPLKMRNNHVKFQILVDHSSIEVFGNDGEAVITCQIFPGLQSTGVEINSQGIDGRLLNFNLWHLTSIWNEDYHQ
jgi:sucrose-6-phosphate hydrolase SacC (GH32 family)